VAVHGFLDGQIGFLDIPKTVEATLEKIPAVPLTSLDDVYAIDAEARAVARGLV